MLTQVPVKAPRAVLVAGGVVTACAVVFYAVMYHIDLDVYRIGARMLLGGGELYGKLPPTEAQISLGFTYPPIAAVLFVPLALVSMPVASALLTLATFVLLAVTTRATLPTLGIRFDARMLFLLGPIALLFEPIRNTLGYGQVNVVLMALVALDCLVPKPRWPRGLLIGIAAAIKLTPAVFVLFLLVRKDYRAAAVSALSFAAMTALGFVASWHDSVRYWTETLFDTARVGGVAYTANQSINGVLARYGFDHATLPWLVASIVVLILAAIGMRRATTTQALALNAFAGLLVSPISWSHHWVWGALAVCAFAVAGSTIPRILAVVGTLLFAIAPHWLMPNSGDRELLWSPWQQIVGNSYFLYAVVVLVLAAFAKTMWRRPE